MSNNIEINVKQKFYWFFFDPNGQLVTNDNCQTWTQYSWWW